MARRDALNLNLTFDANRGNSYMKNKMLEVRSLFLGLSVIYLQYWMQPAYFATDGVS